MLLGRLGMDWRRPVVAVARQGRKVFLLDPNWKRSELRT
jgi:hypothetical protein